MSLMRFMSVMRNGLKTRQEKAFRGFLMSFFFFRGGRGWRKVGRIAPKLCAIGIEGFPPEWETPRNQAIVSVLSAEGLISLVGTISTAHPRKAA